MRGIALPNAINRHSIYPGSFQVILQEVIMAKAGLLTGFDWMLKGRFDDLHLCFYHGSFRHLSRGLESLLNLVLICDYVCEHKQEAIPREKANQYPHDLAALYAEVRRLAPAYGRFAFAEDESLSHEIFSFLHGLHKEDDDCLTRASTQGDSAWLQLANKVLATELTAKTYRHVRTKVLSTFPPFIKIAARKGDQDAINDLNRALSFHLNKEVNPWIIWHLYQLLKPIINLLSKIYLKNNGVKRETDLLAPDNNRMPDMEQLSEFLLYSREEVLEKSSWIEVLENA